MHILHIFQSIITVGFLQISQEAFSKCWNPSPNRQDRQDRRHRQDKREKIDISKTYLTITCEGQLSQFLRCFYFAHFISGSGCTVQCFSLSGWSRALLYGFWCTHKICRRSKIPPYNANITDFFANIRNTLLPDVRVILEREESFTQYTRKNENEKQKRAN